MVEPGGGVRGWRQGRALTPLLRTPLSRDKMNIHIKDFCFLIFFFF